MIPRPEVAIEPTYTVEPPQDGERTVVLRRVGSGQNLMIAYHTPAMAHPDAASLEVLSEILTGGGTGRLDRALEDTGKALSIRASAYSLHDPGVILFSATLNDEQSIEEVPDDSAEHPGRPGAGRPDSGGGGTGREGASSRAWIGPWPTRSALRGS